LFGDVVCGSADTVLNAIKDVKIMGLNISALRRRKVGFRYASSGGKV
jgi:hypothetical protein